MVMIFVGAVMGHLIILLLSVYWLRVLCKGGLRSLMTFVPQPKDKRRGSGGFQFGTDLGRSPRSQKRQAAQAAKAASRKAE